MTPELLRTYANIFRHPRRTAPRGPFVPPSEVCLSAAAALAVFAELVECEPDVAARFLKKAEERSRA